MSAFTQTGSLHSQLASCLPARDPLALLFSRGLLQRLPIGLIVFWKPSFPLNIPIDNPCLYTLVCSMSTTSELFFIAGSHLHALLRTTLQAIAGVSKPRQDSARNSVATASSTRQTKP